MTKHPGDVQSLITIMDFFPSVGFALQAEGHILQPLLLPAALCPSNQRRFTHGERAQSAAGSGAEFLTPLCHSNTSLKPWRELTESLNTALLN